MHIAICGLIGAGKSTLTESLSKEMGLPAYYEPVDDNPYLAKFYQDMKTYGFPMQIWLLNKRYAQHQEIVWRKKGAVQDRSIYEDSIFAKVLYEQGNMTEQDYMTYIELFDNMSHYMQRPDLLVFLDVSPEEALRRMKERARGCEVNVPLDYLVTLHKAYTDFINHISKTIPVIVVDWSSFRTAEEMAKIIHKKYDELSMTL